MVIPEVLDGRIELWLEPLLAMTAEECALWAAAALEVLFTFFCYLLYSAHEAMANEWASKARKARKGKSIRRFCPHPRPHARQPAQIALGGLNIVPDMSRGPLEDTG